MNSQIILLPFLKWAGGKRWLSQHPDFRPPEFNGMYFEPFLGSASIFFSLRPERAVLSDINPELIQLYNAIRRMPQAVWRHLLRHHKQHSSRYYYYVRDEFNPSSEAGKAAKFLYLNRTCWNGLYRVNYKGQFNVPIGTKTNAVLETDDFESASKLLSKAKIVCADFEETIAMAGLGDLIYADPPYTVHHNLNGFVKYNEVLFSWEDQLRLQRALYAARKRGAVVMLSNADHASVRQLYSNAKSIVPLTRKSVISGRNVGRKETSELLICL